MTPAAFLVLNRWWIRQLLNALLRPVFVRWREAERSGNEHAARRFSGFFFTLLDRCDCFPFCVEVDRCGLWILDEPSTDDEGEDFP